MDDKNNLVSDDFNIDYISFENYDPSKFRNTVQEEQILSECTSVEKTESGHIQYMYFNDKYSLTSPDSAVYVRKLTYVGDNLVSDEVSTTESRFADYYKVNDSSNNVNK